MSLAPTTFAPPLATRSIVGWAAMGAALVTWAGFSLSMRSIGASTLSPSDVALLRFAVPALILLPLLPSRLRELTSLPLAPAAMIASGAGLPFFGLVAAGGGFTSAAHVSALVAGTAPLAVSILARLLMGERLALGPGLVTIVLGVVLLVAGLGSFDARAILGAGLLLGASLLWGGYTLGMRMAAVRPLTCLMLVTYPSAIVIAVLKLAGVFDSHLASVDLREILLFAGVQGVGTGIVSTLVYALAVRHLGALRCSTMGALAPVLATAAAMPLLGEQPTVLTLVGVVAVAAGVALANALRGLPKAPALAR
ncbi:EamA family transporter [Aureimonas sp. SK2]|uniref:EamA family transporter n=1 Tax=Aureimonas sp. SK2 TaxID=3015992 RepID=UPI002443CF0D|nr:EamA family transporter [Aureimonas sp. SK2]